MNEAGAACLGEHDFAAFCRRRPGASTIRELLRLDWRRDEPGVITGTVVADAFCHNMVRALAGALLAVGDGRKPVRWLADVLAAESQGSRPSWSRRRIRSAWRRSAIQRTAIWPPGRTSPGASGRRTERTRQPRQLGGLTHRRPQPGGTGLPSTILLLRLTLTVRLTSRFMKAVRRARPALPLGGAQVARLGPDQHEIVPLDDGLLEAGALADRLGRPGLRGELCHELGATGLAGCLAWPPRGVFRLKTPIVAITFAALDK